MKTWLDSVLKPEKHERVFCCNGEQVEDNYKVHYDENGVRMLVKDGKKNTFDEIQSHRESCDLDIIIKKYMMGDFSVLNRQDPLYLDTTEFPKSYAEAFEKNEAAKRYFYSLDPEVREQFNNSVEQFLVAEVDKMFATAPVNNEEVSNES